MEPFRVLGRAFLCCSYAITGHHQIIICSLQDVSKTGQKKERKKRTMIFLVCQTSVGMKYHAEEEPHMFFGSVCIYSYILQNQCSSFWK